MSPLLVEVLAVPRWPELSILQECVIKQSRSLDKRMSKIPLTLDSLTLRWGHKGTWELKGKAYSPGVPASLLAGLHFILWFRPQSHVSPCCQKAQAVWDHRLSQAAVLLISDFSLRCLTPRLKPWPDYSFPNWSGATVAPTSFPPIFSFATDGAIQ